MVRSATTATARFVAGRSAVALLAVVTLLATLTTIVLAADPDNGTVTAASGPVTWTGSFTAEQSTAETGDSCVTATACDVFALTVDLPGDFWDTNDGNVTIEIDWTQPGDDLDLYVFGPSGNSVGSSGQAATVTETVVLNEPANGTYSVRTDPYLVTATTYDGTATLNAETSTGGGGGGDTGNHQVPPGDDDLASADPQGLAFSATVAADNQRDESEPIVDTDLDGNIISCGPSGSSQAAEYASISTDGGDQFHLLGTPPRGQVGSGGGGDCSWDFAPERNEETGRYPFAYTGLGPLTNFTASMSTDGGATIQTTPISGQTIPGVDRQWTVFLNETDVLLSYNQQAPRQVVVQKATDGGLNYGLRVPASPTNPSFPGQMEALPAEFNPTGAENGRVAYFPYNAGNRIFLSVSFDEGDSWTTCHVADSIGDPTLFTTADNDDAGNIYLTLGEDSTYHVYVTYLTVDKLADCNQPLDDFPATDTNPGWATPIQVTRSPVKTAVFPWLVAGGEPGRVAITYYGTQTDGNPNAGRTDADDPTSDGEPLFKASWDVYVAQSLDLLSDDPTFAQVRATTHPFHYDSICQEGLGCTISGGDRSLADFFAIDYDPVRDALVVVYDQGSKRPDDIEGRVATPAVIRQISGPSMSGGTTAIADREALRTGSADPTGDAITGYSTIGLTPLPQANQPAGDFTGVEIGPQIDLETGEPIEDGGFTVTMTVDDLSDAALQQAAAATQGQSLFWILRFVDGFDASAAGVWWNPAQGFSAGYNDYTVDTGQCGGTGGTKCLQYPMDVPVADFDVDQDTGVIRVSVQRDLLEALSPEPAPDAGYAPKVRPDEAPATTGTRMFDATAFSLSNSTSPRPEGHSWLYPLDNTPAFDFLLPGAEDAEPVLSVADATVAEGNSGTTTLSFTASLNAPAPAGGVTFTAATSDDAPADGAATAGDDYVALTDTFTIAEGQTAVDVEVTVNGDETVEEDETLTLTLSQASGATTGDGEATGTIINDDVASGDATFVIDDVTVDEDAGTATFTVTLSESVDGGATVDVATADDTAVAGEDYTAVPTTTLAFPMGTTEQTLDVMITDDALDEDPETFTATLSNATGTDVSIARPTGTATITDDDATPSVSIADAADTAEGDDGDTTDVTFDVTLSAVSGRDVTLDVGTVDGTATFGEDVTAPAASVTIPAGDTTATVTAVINGDEVFEGDETFNVTLTDADHATLGDSSAAATIVEDDPMPTISIASASTAEGDDGDTTELPFTVSLSEAAGVDVTVDVDSTDSSATAGEDYTMVLTTATVEAGATSTTTTVTVLGDDEVEQDESFRMTLSNPSNATLGTATALGTIRDDDEPAATETETPDDDDQTERFGGENRFATAVLASQAQFPEDGSADAVVIARGDDPDGFPDALAGVPFAHQQDAPLLIVEPDRLPAETRNELRRVLRQGGTVHILGGPNAVSAVVEAQISGLGFTTDRIAGATRIDTAVAIAERLGNPDTLFLTTGFNFPDALAAGTAAAVVDGAVLLTGSETRAAATDAYLARFPDADLFAVGGPSARPYPEATPVFGQTREETAVAVAEEFFDDPAAVGIARSDRFPDALSGGPLMASLDSPILLTPSGSLASSTEDYVCDNAGSIALAEIFGGPVAIAPTLQTIIDDRIRGTGC